MVHRSVRCSLLGSSDSASDLVFEIPSPSHFTCRESFNTELQRLVSESPHRVLNAEEANPIIFGAVLEDIYNYSPILPQSPESRNSQARFIATWVEYHMDQRTPFPPDAMSGFTPYEVHDRASTHRYINNRRSTEVGRYQMNREQEQRIRRWLENIHDSLNHNHEMNSRRSDTSPRMRVRSGFSREQTITNHPNQGSRRNHQWDEVGDFDQKYRDTDYLVGYRNDCSTDVIHGSAASSLLDDISSGNNRIQTSEILTQSNRDQCSYHDAPKNNIHTIQDKRGDSYQGQNPALFLLNDNSGESGNKEAASRHDKTPATVRKDSSSSNSMREFNDQELIPRTSDPYPNGVHAGVNGCEFSAASTAKNMQTDPSRREVSLQIVSHRHRTCPRLVRDVLIRRCLSRVDDHGTADTRSDKLLKFMIENPRLNVQLHSPCARISNRHEISKRNEVKRWLFTIAPPEQSCTLFDPDGAGFLGLPGEVRNLIYEACLEYDMLEVRELELMNPAWREPYTASQVGRFFGRSSSSTVVGNDTVLHALVRGLNEMRMAREDDKPTWAAGGSLTALRYRDLYFDRNPDWASTQRAFSNEGCRSLRKKISWGNALPGSVAHGLVFTELIRDPEIVRARRIVNGPEEGPQCLEVQIERKRVEGRRMTVEERRLWWDEYTGGFRGQTALGMTCRQVYREFMPRVYASTIFSVAPRPAAIFFGRPLTLGFAPSALTSIRRLELYRHVDLDESGRTTAADADWERACDLASMALAGSLEQLNVSLNFLRSSDALLGTSSWEAPEGMPDNAGDVDAFERAAWFQPLKHFRTRCRRLAECTVTVQPDPNQYLGFHNRWQWRAPLEALLSRLLLVGPQRLKEEYENGMADWFLYRAGLATFQRYPVYGPMCYEEFLHRQTTR